MYITAASFNNNISTVDRVVILLGITKNLFILNNNKKKTAKNKISSTVKTTKISSTEYQISSIKTEYEKLYFSVFSSQKQQTYCCAENYR